jgi:hypothetical protein
MFSSFQDQHTLYFQMELIPEGELWSALHDTFLGHRAQIGCALSRGDTDKYLLLYNN